MRANPRPRKRSLAAALAVFLAIGQLATRARAHDASDGPPRAVEETPRPVAAGSAAPAGPPPSLRAPSLLVGAGLLTVGLGAWWFHEDEHQKASMCANLPTGFAACTQPASGPGLGVALMLVGAQATLLGVAWMAVRWHARPARVALQLGPGTLALRGTF